MIESPEENQERQGWELHQQEIEELRKEEFGDITLCPDYWDCECDENYIQSKEFTVCIHCGAFEFECPDSRYDEVVNMLESK
jgi:hypothetical protein